MRSRTIVITLLAFLGGISLGGLGQRFFQDFFSHSITAGGSLTYSPKGHPSESVPPPEGYFLQSTSIGRIYIENDNISNYENQAIHVRGKLSTICSRDGIPCYPLLQKTEISKLRDQN